MEEFLNHYGYIALTVGTFFEGETAILVASSLTDAGLFQFHYAVFFGFLGSFVSDWLYYTIGRLNGKFFLEKRPKLKERFKPVERFFGAHRLQILFSYRFLYGFRIIIPVMIGMNGIKPLQFLGYSIFAGLVWATTVGTVGFWVGRFLGLRPVSFEENILWIVLGFGAFGLTLGYFVKRFAEQKMIIDQSKGHS
jgi:membrane protein DedA with SNARE-associated domain